MESSRLLAFCSILKLCTGVISSVNSLSLLLALASPQNVALATHRHSAYTELPRQHPASRWLHTASPSFIIQLLVCIGLLVSLDSSICSHSWCFDNIAAI